MAEGVSDTKVMDSARATVLNPRKLIGFGSSRESTEVHERLLCCFSYTLYLFFLLFQLQVWDVEILVGFSMNLSPVSLTKERRAQDYRVAPKNRRKGGTCGLGVCVVDGVLFFSLSPSLFLST